MRDGHLDVLKAFVRRCPGALRPEPDCSCLERHLIHAARGQQDLDRGQAFPQQRQRALAPRQGALVPLDGGQGLGQVQLEGDILQVRSRSRTSSRRIAFRSAPIMTLGRCRAKLRGPLTIASP